MLGLRARMSSTLDAQPGRGPRQLVGEEDVAALGEPVEDRRRPRAVEVERDAASCPGWSAPEDVRPRRRAAAVPVSFRPRIASPRSTCSTLMTSAPQSASTAAATGTKVCSATSSTRMPLIVPVTRVTSPARQPWCQAAYRSDCYGRSAAEVRARCRCAAPGCGHLAPVQGPVQRVEQHVAGLARVDELVEAELRRRPVRRLQLGLAAARRPRRRRRFGRPAHGAAPMAPRVAPG